MNKEISRFIRLVSFLRRFLSRWRNDEYMDAISRISYDPNMIEVKAYGDENPNVNIYFIQIEGGMGLGGYLRHTLHTLYEADKLGFAPVIKYADECPCKEKEPVNGTDNPFEYYFEQVGPFSIADVYRSRRVFLYVPPHIMRIERDLGDLNPELAVGYNVTDEYLRTVSLIMKKYIRLKDTIKRILKSDKEKVFHGVDSMDQVLGIHIRGTDFALHWKNHPNLITPENYFAVIDEALSQGVSYLFLATDDSRYIEQFEARYGTKLLYYKNTYRSDGTCNIAFEKNDRNKSRYLRGVDVLRDMYTLAECGGLIAGLSQVSIMARIMCLSMDREYRYIKILNNGIYRQ